MSLAAAIRSESTKLFTTSMWWLLALILALYVAFTASVLGFVFAGAATGSLGGSGTPGMTEDGLAMTLYSTATSVGYVFPLLIGTLLVTAEFRHKTLSPTFLATPRRNTVLWAKLAVGVVVGVLYGIVGIVASVGPGAGFLAGFGLDTELTEPETWAMLGRVLLAFVLWVAIGAGVGALVRNQVAAIVGVLVFTQFLEPIGRTAAAFVDGLSTVTQYLPGAASDVLVGASVFGDALTDENALPWWGGGLVLVGYAVVLVLLGAITSWRRDIN
ncbi:ABC transporter permease [Microbacterium koreense]|uniref:ABC transporter permease n=1 Tax=Microbacterium koreense TaxID=323761 RepID=A0ABW2ZN46_9MICO